MLGALRLYIQFGLAPKTECTVVQPVRDAVCTVKIVVVNYCVWYWLSGGHKSGPRPMHNGHIAIHAAINRTQAIRKYNRFEQ